MVNSKHTRSVLPPLWSRLQPTWSTPTTPVLFTSADSPRLPASPHSGTIEQLPAAAFEMSTSTSFSFFSSASSASVLASTAPASAGSRRQRLHKRVDRQAEQLPLAPISRRTCRGALRLTSTVTLGATLVC